MKENIVKRNIAGSCPEAVKSSGMTAQRLRREV